MRIKKKDVILESQLIDLTTEFTPQEKRMLRTLEKKFGPGGSSSDYDRWDGATFLIEEMGIPYDQAYDLSLTFWWYGDKLFKETDKLYKKEDRGYLFGRVTRELLTLYVKGKGEIIADVSITWEDPEHEISKEGVFTITDDVTLWDGYRGITLYIPFNQDSINGQYVDYALRNNNTIMVDIQFIPYDEKDPKVGTHIKVEVTYTIGDSGIDRKEDKVTMMEFDVPYPIPMNKETIYEIFTASIKDVLEKIESMTFTLKVPPPKQPTSE